MGPVITAMFGRKRRKRVTVAVYPDGYRCRIVRERCGWKWKPGCWSEPKAAAIANARAEGARIEVVEE